MYFGIQIQGNKIIKHILYLKDIDNRIDYPFQKKSYNINYYDPSFLKILLKMQQINSIYQINDKLMKALLFDDSSELSKYFFTEDKSSLYNYSTSYNNQTMLLETSIQHRNKPSARQQQNILSQSPELSSKQKSILEDLYQQLEDTISHSQIIMNAAEERQTEKVGELYGICKHLVSTLKRLESKVEMIETKEKKPNENCKREDRKIDSQRQIESILTYSSMNSSKTKSCKCENDKNSKVLMNNIFEYVEQKSKLQIYKQQNEELKKQMLRLQIANEQMKKTIKKLEGQNMKVKELLKQYQNFSKKQNNYQNYNEKEDLYERKQVFVRSNTHQDHILSPTVRGLKSERYTNLKPTIQDKQNIKEAYEKKIKQQQMNDFMKSNPMTPNPLVKKATKTQVLTTLNRNEQGGQMQSGCIYNARKYINNLYNQKTKSKSKENRIKHLHHPYQSNKQFGGVRNGLEYYHSDEKRQKQGFCLRQKNQKQPVLDYVDTMSSLPDNSQDIYLLKRIKSSYLPVQKFSPFKSGKKYQNRWGEE